jgi:hypothetical protein
MYWLFDDPITQKIDYIKFSKFRNWLATMLYRLFLIVINSTQDAFENEIFEAIIDHANDFYRDPANY